MDSPMLKATVQASCLSLLSNVLGQLIGCYQAGSPYAINARELVSFAAFSIFSCPPNFIWQTWLEATFPGYTETLTPKEKEMLVDETVAGSSTSTETVELRASNEKKFALTDDSAPDAQKVRKILNVRNTLAKFLLDQTLGAAVNTVLFIMGIAMFRGQSWESGLQQTREGFWPLIRAGQKLWPMVSLISLTLVPVERRMVFGSCIGVGWGVFLSLMSGGKKAKAD